MLGSPIAHSLSPALHRAAYAYLGLDWDYGRHEVVADELASFVAGCGPEWRGLSLTMPLKEAALELGEVDEVARLAGGRQHAGVRRRRGPHGSTTPMSADWSTP